MTITHGYVLLRYALDHEQLRHVGAVHRQHQRRRGAEFTMKRSRLRAGKDYLASTVARWEIAPEGYCEHVRVLNATALLAYVWVEDLDPGEQVSVDVEINDGFITRTITMCGYQEACDDTARHLVLVDWVDRSGKVSGQPHLIPLRRLRGSWRTCLTQINVAKACAERQAIEARKAETRAQVERLARERGEQLDQLGEAMTRILGRPPLLPITSAFAHELAAAGTRVAVEDLAALVDLASQSTAKDSCDFVQ